MIRYLCAALVLSLVISFSASAEEVQPDTPNHAKATTEIHYPHIVLYSVAWCPHCRKAKEFLARHGIPYVNRDVEADVKAFEDLTIKYNSSKVPLIVFGNGKDEIVMNGFTPELFQETLQQALSK